MLLIVPIHTISSTTFTPIVSIVRTVAQMGTKNHVTSLRGAKQYMIVLQRIYKFEVEVIENVPIGAQFEGICHETSFAPVFLCYDVYTELVSGCFTCCISQRASARSFPNSLHYDADWR